MSVSELAYRFESILFSLDPQSNGSVKMTLLVSPTDVNDVFLEMKIGGIFMVAAVEVSDTGEPAKPPLMEKGARALKTAAALCRNERFQTWLKKTGRTTDLSEETAAKAVRTACGIKSRSILRTSQKAMLSFEKMLSEFKESIRSGKA